ncbi:ABC transporter ATP-binding protein [Pseudoclavibacter sp. RFBB5]|uniref:ABC transporter ATP-binding protein n=1 Tax=Pseudoclavibacter sp. RFBB5 TaxID=2080574 RepID=UPI000CE84DB9|nr:ABC transporter ATP-binding protein [Pseudoclavibacter sp. RFBB5]PPG29188.1 ABC transporter ATP-binding protein [Pseudoclavibacter sp. RFBB5]
MPAVRVEGASVRRGGTLVLASVDFEVAAGSILCLTGENGSGKTTVLRTLTGQVSPSSGHVLVGGEPVDERSSKFRRRLAALLGSVPFSMTMTAREHLTAVAASWGASVRDANASADEVLARLGILDLADRFPHELSSGQFQLLSLATALARPFEVLVLDEPEQRLDEHRRELLARILTEERERGAAIVVATHSRPLIYALGAAELRLGGSPGARGSTPDDGLRTGGDDDRAAA